jgi:integrase
MASVFKRKRDRQRKNSSWYIGYSDANGKRRTVKGCPDKSATEAMARKIESDAELRRRGVIDPKIDQYRAHESVALAEHLEAWRVYLLGKGNSERHANEGHARVVNLMALAKATRLSDLTLTPIQTALAALKDKGRSLRTIHHHASLAKNFAKWAWHDGRTREDLLAHLSLPDNPESDRRRQRRALPEADLMRLTAFAESGPERGNLSGTDRAMLYRIAAGTGFRSEELQSLTPESFALDGDYPTITVEPKDSKRRRRDVQPIHAALASMLKAWLAQRPEGQPVFPADRWQILEALKADLKVAGIEYETDEGFADVHSLRHGYITALAKSNAPVKIVQSLARHSTPVLTLGVYTHLGLYDQTPALDALPDLTKTPPTTQTARKIGTDDISRSGLDSALTAPGQRAEVGTVRSQSVPDVIADSHASLLTIHGSLENKRSDTAMRTTSAPVGYNSSAGSVSAAGARPGLQNR